MEPALKVGEVSNTGPSAHEVDVLKLLEFTMTAVTREVSAEVVQSIFAPSLEQVFPAERVPIFPFTCSTFPMSAFQSEERSWSFGATFQRLVHAANPTAYPQATAKTVARVNRE